MDDMNDEDSQMFEISAGFIANNYPKALRDFYNKCNTEGFNPDQCMSLTGKYFEILLLNAANSEPDDSDSGEFELGD